jgi:hypothetical protein
MFLKRLEALALYSILNKLAQEHTEEESRNGSTPPTEVLVEKALRLLEDPPDPPPPPPPPLLNGLTEPKRGPGRPKKVQPPSELDSGDSFVDLVR